MVRRFIDRNLLHIRIRTVSDKYRNKQTVIDRQTDRQNKNDFEGLFQTDLYSSRMPNSCAF